VEKLTRRASVAGVAGGGGAGGAGSGDGDGVGANGNYAMLYQGLRKRLKCPVCDSRDKDAVITKCVPMVEV
jgi:hypothetical protein